MSVVLSILKIIGIILLVILCVVLALLLIVLFVPFRYRAHVVMEERGPDAGAIDGLSASAGVSWLLHLISYEVRFEDKKLAKGLKIFGIDFGKRKKEKEKEKKKKRKVPKEGPERPLSDIAAEGRKKKAGHLVRDEEPDDTGQAADDADAEDAAAGAIEEGQTGNREDAAESIGGLSKEEIDALTEKDSMERKEAIPESAGSGTPSAAGSPEEPAADTGVGSSESGDADGKPEPSWKKVRRPNPNKARSFTDFLWLIADKIYQAIRKLIAKIKGIIARIKAVYAKIKKWTDFLQDERTQKAIVLALKEVGGILKGLLPKKVKGYVRYGSGDPCKTGQTLGYLAAAYPLYGRSLSIYPDFEEKTLEGDIDLKGRVFLATIVWAGLKLILNKNIKYVISFVRNKEENANGGE